MLNLQLARKYSSAIFELAQEEQQLVPYGEQLRRVLDNLSTVPGIWGYFANPLIQRSDKKALLKQLFEGELSANVYHFLLLLADKRRMALYPAIVEDFEKLSNEARGIVIADVTTAHGMSEAQREKLGNKLEAVTGKTVKLRLHEDPKIIGGVIVRIGDKRIDGSVTGKLSALADELMAYK